MMIRSVSSGVSAMRLFQHRVDHTRIELAHYMLGVHELACSDQAPGDEQTGVVDVRACCRWHRRP